MVNVTSYAGLTYNRSEISTMRNQNSDGSIVRDALDMAESTAKECIDEAGSFVKIGLSFFSPSSRDDDDERDAEVLEEAARILRKRE